jgi:hypothetical protein
MECVEGFYFIISISKQKTLVANLSFNALIIHFHIIWVYEIRVKNGMYTSHNVDSVNIFM